MSSIVTGRCVPALALQSHSRENSRTTRWAKSRASLGGRSRGPARVEVNSSHLRALSTLPCRTESPTVPSPTLSAEAEVRTPLVRLEASDPVHTGKGKSDPQPKHDPRVGVAPRNEDADFSTRLVVPFNGKAVGDVLGRNAKCCWGVIRSRALQGG